MTSTNDGLKSRIHSVLEAAVATISSLAEAYGLRDSSGNRIKLLGANIEDAQFIGDIDLLKKEESDDEVLKSENDD